MKNLNYLQSRLRRHVYLGMVTFWLVASIAWAGDPIVFIRQAEPANPLELPGGQVNKRVATMLDALDAPNPLDGLSPGPSVERPRQGRDSRARRAELARKARENKSWIDDGKIEEEDDTALTEELDLDETDARLAAEQREPRRPTARSSASERRADERDARIPAHLLSPQVRQRMQAEAAARRRQGQDTSETGLGGGSSQGVDLSKMLAPSDEARGISPGMSRGARDFFAGPEVRRGNEPGELGSVPGTELITGPNLTGPRLGADLGEARLGPSLLDRNLDPEARFSARTLSPSPGEVPRSFNSFPAFRDEVRTTLPSTLPGNAFGPTYRDGAGLDDLNRPRRGGTLGR